MKNLVRIAIVVGVVIVIGVLAVLLRVDCNQALAIKRINNAQASGKKVFVPVCLFDRSGRSWLYTGRPAGRISWAFNGTQSLKNPKNKVQYIVAMIKDIRKSDEGYVVTVGGMGQDDWSLLISDDPKDKVMLATEKLSDEYLNQEDDFINNRWNDEVEVSKVFLNSIVKKNDLVVVELNAGNNKSKPDDELVRLIIRRRS